MSNPSGTDGKMPRSRAATKSTKILQSAGKKAAGRKTAVGPGLPRKREVPWLTIGAVIVVLALIGGITWEIYPKWKERQDERREAAQLVAWQPTEANPDPSKQLNGIVLNEYPAGLHVQATQRVSYDQAPPFGGPHDASWADCMGVVYPTAVRSENVVHSLEHGAVWIAYNPEKVTGEALTTLEDRVEGKQFTAMSPYPGLDKPIAVLAWGHQLKVDRTDDERIAQFITALRQSQFNAPEPNGTCSNPTFDSTAAPFVAEQPTPGPDTIPMDTAGLTQDPSEMGLGAPPGPAETAPAPSAPTAPAPEPAG